MKTVYLISGPLGVGKTTLTQELHQALENSALMEGDVFLHEVDTREDLTWEQKLEYSWQKILEHTKGHLQKGLDVVIDFVVEEELPWFFEQISGMGAVLKYVVLTTTKEQIIERLKKRNELQYLDRALVLLEKLTRSPQNAQYLYDTINTQEISVIVDDIISSDRFTVELDGISN